METEQMSPVRLLAVIENGPEVLINRQERGIFGLLVFFRCCRRKECKYGEYLILAIERCVFVQKEYCLSVTVSS